MVAFVLRGLHLWQLSRSPFGSIVVGDGAAYDAWARAVVAGDWLSRHQGVFYQSPLYPYFLAFVYLFFGHHLSAVFGIQALLGMVSCVLLARAGRVLFSPTAGTVAGFAFALYGPAVFFEGVVQKAALDSVLLATCWFAFAQLKAAPSVGAAAALGFFSSALSLNRENALVLGVLFAGWIWAKQREDSWPKPKPYFGVFLLAFSLPLAVTLARNLAVGGELAITTAQFGPNLFIGNNPNATGMYDPLLPGRGNPAFEREDARVLAEQAVGRSLSPGEVSRFWARKAVGFIVEYPGKWLALLGKKLLLAVNGVEVADVDDFYGRVAELPALRLAMLRFAVVFAFGVAGWVASLPLARQLWPFLAAVPLYLASVAAFFVLARYRFPLAVLLVPFASAAVHHLFEGSRRRKTSILASCVAALAVTQLPMVDKRSQEASSYVTLGDVYLERRQEPEKALFYYQKAVAAADSSAEAHLRLAVAAKVLGRRELAETHFREASRLAPGWGEVFLRWGQHRYEQGDYSGAAVHFATACQLPGAGSEAWRWLGDALFKVGRLEQALEAYEKAWAAGGDPVIANNLGAALAQLRRWAEAERWLRQAAEADPGYAEPRVNLAKVYLATGRWAQAREALEEALRIAPEHPEARKLSGVAAGRP
ncbi:MAG: tetratricopeptide repeat protein [Thermoanaerobaculum sp.]